MDTQQCLKTDSNLKLTKPRSFASKFFALFIPSALQNLVVIIVFFINNIFISQLSHSGTLIKTSLGIANPVLNFVLLIILAWSGGLSIMMGQYYGSKDHHKNQQLVLIGFSVGFVLWLPFFVLLQAIPSQLMNFMSGNSLNSDNVLQQMNEYGSIYLRVMAFSFIGFIFVEIMSTGFQTTNKSIIPLYSSIIYLCINLVFVPVSVHLLADNPKLSIILIGVIDNIAKWAQVIFLILYIYFKKYTPIYFLQKIIIKKEVFIKCIKYGWSSFLNDAMFGLFLVIQTFSLLNYSSNVDANNFILNNNTSFNNIQESTTNVNILLEFSNVIWPGMATATSVLVGSCLGENDIKTAKQNAKRSLLWSFIVSLLLVLFIFGLSWFINNLLNPNSQKWINSLAMYMEWVLLPIILSQGIFSVLYFSIRSGGSKIIVLCDSLIMGIWTIMMLILTMTNTLNKINPILYIFILQFDQIIRMVVCAIMFKYYRWANNLTKN